MRKLLGFLALAGLLFVIAPTYRAEAAVMAPGIASTMQQDSQTATTEVRWRRGGGWGRRHYAPRRFYGPRFHPRRHHWRRW